MTAETLQRRLSERSADLVRSSETSAAQWARLSKQIEQRMLRILEAEGRPITPQEAARILAELRKTLGMGAREAMTLADKQALDVLAQTFSAQSEYFASAFEARSAFAIRSTRVARTFRYYDQRIKNGDFLRGEYWTRKRVDWAQEFIDRNVELRKEVQRRMTQTMATGQQISTRDLAAAIRPQVDGLSGRMPADQWAKAYARTEYQQLSNEFSEQLAVQAGIDKFANVGVPDDRQSRICYEASQQKPMTMAEWDASVWGRPGSRHVFNCRCIAAPVPDSIKNDDWTQPNEKFEEVMV